MVDILKRNEAPPLAYPDAPSGLSTAAAALDADMIWARIESYTAHRFTAREVVWIVAGLGDFSPDLTPATITYSEIWTNSGWAEVFLPPTPLGGLILDDEAYRITAQVGGGDVPAPVNEAFARLAEYLADETDRAGASDYSVNLGGAIQESYKRNPNWVAKAMQQSGAGDLLRPYRRA